MNRIQTNKLEVDLKADLLSDIYEVYNVKTSDNHFGKGNNAAKLVDDFTNESFVLSVVYERGNSFYMMLRKSNDNIFNINKALKRLPGTNNISMSPVAIGSVPQNIMVQLLFNSLGTYEGKILGFHNVTGHFYIHHPKWIKSKQIITIELKVTKEMVLDWSVRTFTSVSQQKFIKFGKRKFDEYPEYVLSKDLILKRVEKGTCQDAYILRQIGEKKSNIKFLDIDTLDGFQKTKMGILCACIDKFNTQFKDVAHVSFDSFSDYQEESVSTSMVRTMEKRFDELASSCRIILVDNIMDTTSPKSLEVLKKKLKERFNCEISVLKRPKSDSINIVLIHEDAEYKDKNDPHDKQYKGCAVQHVTIETIAHLMDAGNDEVSGWKSVLDCLMQEVLIKKDLADNRISMVNWQDYHFSDDLLFGICQKNEDGAKRYYFMRIRPDGVFTVVEQENSLFEQNEYQDCINIFGHDDVVGVVKKGNDINVIHNTKLRTIPEIELIKERLQNNDNKLRNKTSREDLFPAITDIKCFANDGHSLCYFSGIIGAGMKSVIQTAANIRMVDSYRNSNLFFPDLLKLMAVTFVRNRQLTVMPFPFKYLLEYIRKKSLYI